MERGVGDRERGKGEEDRWRKTDFMYVHTLEVFMYLHIKVEIFQSTYSCSVYNT